MKLRTFLAFDVPDAVRRQVSALIRDLQQYEDGVAWTPPENLHVTMRFFGEVEERLLQEEIVPRVGPMVLQYAPLTMDCSGVGVFPNWKYPRVIWAGIGGMPETILTLHDDLNRALFGLPIAEDERAFRLHLTIGRSRRNPFREPLVRRVESLGPVSFGEIRIDRLTLYKSQLTKQGAVYTPLHTFPLGPATTTTKEST